MSSPTAIPDPAAPGLAHPGYRPRSPWMPLLFAPAVLLSGLSWTAGGTPGLTDLAFLALTAAAAGLLLAEMTRFSQRFGIGGIILFGGILLWFSYDYLKHWFGIRWHLSQVPFRPDVLAKATFFHSLFVLMMAAGLLIPPGRWPLRLVQAVPEPGSDRFFFRLVLAMFVIGVLPYFLFTAEPWYQALWLEMTQMRAGGATWTVGRTGNVNYGWGAYIVVLIQVGQVGGQLAVFYALLMGTPFRKAVCWLIWLFWLLMAFGTGNRSEVVFSALPAAGLVFLKYQSLAGAVLARLGKRAYLYAGAILLLILFLAQFQAAYRASGWESADVRQVSLTDLQGNAMFSEGLLGYEMIPRQRGYFYDRWPGEALLSPLPRTAYWFVVSAIPRALWTGKPIDPVWVWYNQSFTGEAAAGETYRGVTVAQGMVGYWYFRYGLAGVVQGGLLLGWLMRFAETILQQARGRAMQILAALVLANWLFEGYRGLNFHNLYPSLIGLGGVALLLAAGNALTTRK